MTQEQLGKLLGVSRQTVGALERGRFDPPITMAYYISLILEQPLNELFDFESIEINIKNGSIERV
ncbi:helix-turn-helix protein [Methanobrevibacter cuticularis]|uniref:Helix-turn-helix protein n=2 Tax=Methanobrevibacter cuticularis TaxID=47311 RepID=A0A166DIY6_9EURY|nr:helix-turn-helix protein [Methanobrevibacter cuticularis]